MTALNLMNQPPIPVDAVVSTQLTSVSSPLPIATTVVVPDTVPAALVNEPPATHPVNDVAVLPVNVTDWGLETVVGTLIVPLVIAPQLAVDVTFSVNGATVKDCPPATTVVSGVSTVINPVLLFLTVKPNPLMSVDGFGSNKL